MTSPQDPTNAPPGEGHSPVANLRVDLAYDGSPFHGYARQPELRTVQGNLEEALARLLGHDVDLTCAGRTDAGVHAIAQVVACDVRDTPRADRFLERLRDDPLDVRLQVDRATHEAITVWRVSEAPSDFNPRFDATGRHYRYVLFDGPARDPRARHTSWQVRERLDVDAMHTAAQHLVGEHDYATFCRLAPGGHTRRGLTVCDVARVDTDVVHVVLQGPAFCHQLCRSIVGCLVEVGRGRKEPDWIAEILAARDRSRAAPVARPDGLTLEAVTYPDPYPDAPWRS